MDFVWHMLELSPFGFLVGWAWVRWHKSAPPEPIVIRGDKPTIFDPNPHMIFTDAPKGRGDVPARAIKAVRHPMQQYPIWQLDERGWPTAYKLVPLGYKMDDRGAMIQHANPMYNGIETE